MWSQIGFCNGEAICILWVRNLISNGTKLTQVINFLHLQYIQVQHFVFLYSLSGWSLQVSIPALPNNIGKFQDNYLQFKPSFYILINIMSQHTPKFYLSLSFHFIHSSFIFFNFSYLIRPLSLFLCRYIYIIICFVSYRFTAWSENVN